MLDKESSAGFKEEQVSEEPPAEELTPAHVQDQVERLRFLDTRRADLGYKLYQMTGQTREQREEGAAEQPETLEKNLTIDQEKQLIVEGNVGRIKFDSEAEDEVSQNIILSLKADLQETEKEINEISQHSEVIDAYREYRARKIEVINKINEAHKIESLFNTLDRQEVAVLKGGKGEFSQAEQDYIHRINELRRAAQQRIAELEKDVEVGGALRVHELMDYKEQLRKGHFAETPSRKEYIAKVLNHWLQGKHIMLTGPTGTGKTEIFRELLRTFWDKELSETLISGSQTVTDYTLFGKPGGMKASAEGGMDVYFTPAGFTVGMKEGLPVILDEFDLLDTNTRLRLKALYNFRPGDEYTVQEDTSYKIKIKEGFCIGATANIKSEKHKERFALDPAENRVWDEVRIDYLPKEELFDVCLAKLLDKRGRLPLNLEEVGALSKLVDAASFVQECYMGVQSQIFEAGAGSRKNFAVLEQAVLDPGKVLGFLDGWDQARIKGVNFSDFVENQLLDFTNKEGYPEKDRRLLAQIFIQKYGFFADRNPQEFLIPNLDEKQLSSWRTAKK